MIPAWAIRRPQYRPTNFDSVTSACDHIASILTLQRIIMYFIVLLAITITVTALLISGITVTKITDKYQCP